MNQPQHVKLLIAAHSGSRGGAEYCLDTLLEHLDRQRFEARVLFAWDGPMVEMARQRGYSVEIWPWAWWMGYEPTFWHWRNVLLGSMWRAMRLARRLRRERFTVVYTNTAVIFEPALAARWAGVPHVWHVHEILGPQSMRPHLLPWRWMVRAIGRWSKRVIFESHAARQQCQGLIPEEKMRVVYNSVRFRPWEEAPSADIAKGNATLSSGGQEGFPPHPAWLAPSHPLPRRGEGEEVPSAMPLSHDEQSGEQPCRVVWIGRLSERKDPISFLQAIARMQLRDRCQFLLVGTGPLEEQVRQMITQLGLAEYCQLLGFQEDVQSILREADVLVLTSREESFGLVLAEAGAFGLPVIATRTQGPTEIVLDGQTGFLVDVGDIAGLAAWMDRLAADPTLRRQMGQAGLQRVRQLFDPVKNTRQIEQIILEASFERMGVGGQ
ncbi:MAG: glycosyltransferase family 4 protein [Thermoguttaceae bacterium]|nr:glycosyltransferase family 4 protein [Thermoguttaceae bacterium]